MSKPKVYICRKLPQRALDMIEKECDMGVHPHDRAMTSGELEEAIQGVEGILTLLTEEINEEILKLNPDLKVVANYAVGYDNIDLQACTDYGVKVSNTPGVLTDTTADLAWALLMAIARRIVEADKYTRAGNYEEWGPMLFLGGDIYGKTLGLIGMGRIGQAVAQRARAFNMKVLYYDVERKSLEKENELGLIYREFEDLIKEVDFLSLHVPLVESTRHLIGEKELQKMKNTAYLINTSRGAVIDEKALKIALEEKEIAGAALDVYENEPAITPGLHKLDNVILTPHIGSASTATRTKMAVMAAENLIAGVKGKEMPNLLNSEALSL